MRRHATTHAFPGATTLALTILACLFISRCARSPILIALLRIDASLVPSLPACGSASPDRPRDIDLHGLKGLRFIGLFVFL